MWLIKEIKTGKYIYRYFGNRWTRTFDLSKATRFKNKEEVQED